MLPPDQYQSLTNIQLADALGCSISTARRRKREAGVQPAANPFPRRASSTPAPCDQYPLNRLRDGAWLREQYLDERRGTHVLGKMLSVAPTTVRRSLLRHAIPLRLRRVSRHPYARDDAWLRRNYVEERLSISACAQLAGVANETIRSWLLSLGLGAYVRDRREAARKADSTVRYP